MLALTSAHLLACLAAAPAVDGACDRGAAAVDCVHREAQDVLVGRFGSRVELQESVFVLFAAFNGLGYAQETQRGRPPLEAPMYHPLRTTVREALSGQVSSSAFGGRGPGSPPATQASGSALAALRRVFDEQPLPREAYLAMTIAAAAGTRQAQHGTAEEKPATPEVPDLLPLLRRFRAEQSIDALFDKTVEDHRRLVKGLIEELDRRVEALERLMEERVQGPTDLVVLSNPLDALDHVHRVRAGGFRFLVVHPASAAGRAEILVEHAKGVVAPWVTSIYPRLPSYRRSWESQGAAVVRRRFSGGEAYLAEALARSLIHRAENPASEHLDRAFVERHANEGLHWVRPMLRLIDQSRGVPLRQALPRWLPRIDPEV